VHTPLSSLKKKLYAKDPFFRLLFATGGGIVIILVLLLIRHLLCYETTDDAFVDGHIVPVSPKVPSYVAKVLVKDNQAVKSGELLVELEPDDYIVRNDMAKAELDAAVAEAEQAHKDMERYRALSKTDEISQQDLDRAILQAKTADARVASAKARVRQTDLEVSYTKIYAPADGHVTKKAVEEGAFVQTGQPLMAIVLNKKWVTANFKETQLTHMRPGQVVKIKIDTYPGKTFKGRIDSFQHGTGARFSLLPPENATGNYVKVVQRIPVKIVFDGPPFEPTASPEDSGRPGGEKTDEKYTLAIGMSVVPEVKVR